MNFTDFNDETADSKFATGPEGTANALNAVTNASCNHHLGPLDTLHRPADHEASHGWLSKHIPTSAVQHLENNWHMVRLQSVIQDEYHC